MPDLSPENVIVTALTPEGQAISVAEACKGMTCDCCQRKDQPVIGVASSCLGAISFAFCLECASNYAEPEFMIEFTYFNTGEEGAADWVKELSTFKDGRFMKWQEWVDLENTKTPNLAERSKAFWKDFENACDDVNKREAEPEQNPDSNQSAAF